LSCRPHCWPSFVVYHVITRSRAFDTAFLASWLQEMDGFPMKTTRSLAILLFDDVEVLDFCGPFEVFSVANRFTDPPAFNVLTVAEKAGPVLTRGGLTVNPHCCLLDCRQPHLLLVTAGQRTRRLMRNGALLGAVRQLS